MNDSNLYFGEADLKRSTRRRILTVSAGALASGLAGCTGTSPREVSADGSQLEGFDASDISIGDTTQRVQVELSGAEPGAEINVYADLTSLTAANVGTQNLGIVAETAIGATGWLVSGAETDGLVVEITVEVENLDEVADFAAVNIAATGLHTDAAADMDGLKHSVTLSTANGEPDFTTGATATYDIINPEEIANVLRVSPSDIRVGETSQQVGILIERATDAIEFRLDLSPLREMGAEISGADAVVEETAGERRDDEGDVEIEVTEATIVEDIVQISITTTADTLAVDIRITGLDTDDAEATNRLTYPVYTGERPSEPTASNWFSISGAVT